MIFNRDINRILRIYNKSDDENTKIDCANDLYRISEITQEIFPDEEAYYLTPEMDKLLEKAKAKERQSLRQIYNLIINNIDLLKNIYKIVFDILSSYDNKRINTSCVDSLNIPLIYNFFKEYPQLYNFFDKTLRGNHIVFVNDIVNSFCYCLYSLKESNIFISSDEGFMINPALVHELGHAYQDKLDDYNSSKELHLLIEFIPLLIELLFINYSQDMNNNFMNYELQSFSQYIRIALTQLNLITKYKDAVKGFEINQRYRRELDASCPYSYSDKYSLCMQWYATNFLLAISYFYKMRNGLSFNEIKKFYKENSLNIFEILNHIDINLVSKFLEDYYPKDRLIRKKTS